MSRRFYIKCQTHDRRTEESVYRERRIIDYWKWRVVSAKVTPLFVLDLDQPAQLEMLKFVTEHRSCDLNIVTEYYEESWNKILSLS